MPEPRAVRRRCVVITTTLGLALPAARAAALTETDAASGVRAALERGAVAAVGLLGRTDGFLGNPRVRIPLPGWLKDASRLLKAIGQGGQVDALVEAMNRAAEQAVPEARELLVATARSIGVDDALKMVRGGPTSVTDWFAARTRAPLTDKFLPIVARTTDKVDLAARYDRVAARAQGLGLVKKDDADVRRYVTAKALDGLYLVIGDEEKKIRADPIGSGSAILKKVFGG